MSGAATGIEVWHVDLDAADAAMDGVLAADERARAARFATPLLSRRFVAARAALRGILARRLEADPAALRFVAGPWGKPALAGAASALRFNLSHSEDRMVCAVAADRDVGIDIERRRDDVDVLALAHRFFSAREVAALTALDAGDRLDGFYAGWTRKEAYIKATGRGLATPLDSFSVSLAPGEPARLIEIDGAAEAAARWSMSAFATAPGFAAALVIEGPATPVRHAHWPDGAAVA